MIRIEAVGLRATVQDRGRFGHSREGVPPSGPADPAAFAAAQVLVGNDGDAAAIEIVGDAFTFRCEERRIVAVTGRDVALRGRDLVPGWTAAFARPGETLTVVCGERSRFAYLAVSGGIATEPILGSRSAYLPAGLGRALRAGELLPLGQARVDVDRAGRLAVSPDYDTGQIRAITGPHAQRFTDEADSLFFSSEFRVEPASDRMGTRLSGPRIVAREGEPRSRERRDHQAVPGGEDLGVGERGRPPRPHLVEDGANAIEEGQLPGVGHVVRRKHVAALEVAFLGHAPGLLSNFSIFLAKRFNMASELGALLDPLADKALLVSIYMALGIWGAVPRWIVILVVSRDIMKAQSLACARKSSRSAWVSARRVRSSALAIST